MRHQNLPSGYADRVAARDMGDYEPQTGVHCLMQPTMARLLEVSRQRRHFAEHRQSRR